MLRTWFHNALADAAELVCQRGQMVTLASGLATVNSVAKHKQSRTCLRRDRPQPRNRNRREPTNARRHRATGCVVCGATTMCQQHRLRPDNRDRLSSTKSKRCVCESTSKTPSSPSVARYDSLQWPPARSLSLPSPFYKEVWTAYFGLSKNYWPAKTTSETHRCLRWCRFQCATQTRTLAHSSRDNFQQWPEKPANAMSVQSAEQRFHLSTRHVQSSHATHIGVVCPRARKQSMISRSFGTTQFSANTIASKTPLPRIQRSIACNGCQRNAIGQCALLVLRGRGPGCRTRAIGTWASASRCTNLRTQFLQPKQKQHPSQLHWKLIRIHGFCANATRR